MWRNSLDNDTNNIFFYIILNVSFIKDLTNHTLQTHQELQSGVVYIFNLRGMVVVYILYGFSSVADILHEFPELGL